jgi:hypothetical protein
VTWDATGEGAIAAAHEASQRTREVDEVESPNVPIVGCSKYRGPDGETWAGRGATPRWLKAALEEGKKIEDFLIDKTIGKARVKRRAMK